MCHKFVLQLVDTVTRSPETEKAVGTLYSGSAFVLNHGAQQTITLMDSRAEVPPAPRATPYDYPSDAAALQPTRSYTPFDCRPCTIGSVNGASAALLDAFNNVTCAAFQLDVAAAATCTKTTPTSTPTPTADGSSHAADAATAVAVAKAGILRWAAVSNYF
jgi:hypothetical protein